MASFEALNDIERQKIDGITDATMTVAYSHHEIHAGSKYYVNYSVASLGAMTTPDDMVTLTFTTPDTEQWGHFEFNASGTAGWRLRLIEAPTGGAATPTGTLDILNQNRNSSNVSTMVDIGSTAGKVSYDATLATGGITLYDDYITGSTSGQLGNNNSSTRDEIILKQNTTYQISLFGTDTDPATINISWYEHTNEQ